MTDDQLRHKTVAVAIIYDPQHGFLLWNNKRWGGYAFPMKHMEDIDNPVQTGLRAVNEPDFPLALTGASGVLVERTAELERSNATGQKTKYRYYLVEVYPGTTLDKSALHPDFAFVHHNEIADGSNFTWSTLRIVESLKLQEVAVSLIWRRVGDKPEFLLVWKPRGYFFASVRLTPETATEDNAKRAVRLDTAYTGDVEAECVAKVSHVHESKRFGIGERTYFYYVCETTFPGVNLSQTGNALEESLDAFGAAQASAGRDAGDRGYWSWFTRGELEERGDISPDIQSLLPTITTCVGKLGG